MQIKSRFLETIYIKSAFRNNDSRASRAERHDIDPVCQKCFAESETIEHIFYVCPAYVHPRIQLFERVGHDRSLTNLLCNPDNRKHVESFLEDTSLSSL